jgi:exopolysaccharide production protein ExoZ
VNSVESDGAAPSHERLLSSIQALRAFAAWSVVLHHYCLIFPVDEPGAWRQAFIDHGAAGVDVFFVVSGLVMGLSANDPAITPRRFLAKRIGRIVPAYWVTTLIIAFLIVRMPQMMVNQGYSDELLVKSLLFIPTQNPNGLGFLPINSVGWSLNLEVVFYLIVALSLFAPRAQRWIWIAAGLVLVHKLLSPLEIINDFYRDPVIYEFMMGIGVAFLWRSGAMLSRRPWIFAGLAVFALVCLTRPAPPWGLVRAVDYGPPAFLLVCAFLGLEPYFARARALVHLGNHSYSVYLIHPTILYAGWYLHVVRHWGIALATTTCFIAIVSIGAASYHFLERPAGRLLTRALSPRDR